MRAENVNAGQVVEIIDPGPDPDPADRNQRQRQQRLGLALLYKK